MCEVNKSERMRHSLQNRKEINICLEIHIFIIHIVKSDTYIHEKHTGSVRQLINGCLDADLKMF